MCDIFYKNKIVCDFCDEIISKTNLSKHRKVCKNKPKDWTMPRVGRPSKPKPPPVSTSNGTEKKVYTCAPPLGWSTNAIGKTVPPLLEDNVDTELEVELLPPSSPCKVEELRDEESTDGEIEYLNLKPRTNWEYWRDTFGDLREEFREKEARGVRIRDQDFIEWFKYYDIELLSTNYTYVRWRYEREIILREHSVHWVAMQRYWNRREGKAFKAEYDHAYKMWKKYVHSPEGREPYIE